MSSVVLEGVGMDSVLCWVRLFLASHSCGRLSRLVRPLQTRGEPLPEDEDWGWPGPSAFCISKVLSQQKIITRRKKIKNLQTVWIRRHELLFQITKRHQLGTFVDIVMVTMVPLCVKLPTPPPPIAPLALAVSWCCMKGRVGCHLNVFAPSWLMNTVGQNVTFGT
jgi:hypothetical protein